MSIVHCRRAAIDRAARFYHRGCGTDRHLATDLRHGDGWAHTGPRNSFGRDAHGVTLTPDGRFAFVTLRGPEPLSGPHAIRGSSPGVAVIDVSERQLVEILLPEPDLAISDFHGIGMRPLQ